MHGLLAMHECKKLTLTRHTESMSVKIPEERIKELLKKLKEDAFFKTIAIIM
jgi:hypothetical protein